MAAAKANAAGHARAAALREWETEG